MASFNKVILVGNLTRDPEVRYIPSGSAVCEIGLAVNRTWFDKASNSRKEDVTFVDVTLWGRTAEIAGEYLAKGRQVLIEGRLQLDSWQDKETGKNRSKLKVVGEQMTMLGSREGGGGGGNYQGGQGQSEQSGGRQSAPQQDPADAFYGDGPSDGGGAGPSGGGGGGDVPF